MDDTEKLTEDNLMAYTFETTSQDEDGKSVTEEHKLSEFAKVSEGASVSSINRENQERYISVTADTMEGYNTTLLSRTVEDKLDDYKTPEGYRIEIAGESTQVMSMMHDMLLMITLAIIFIYLIMVAQFQSLLSPFIVMGTVPLAFAGAFLGLLIGNFTVSIVAMIGLIMLMGVVVNNGIVLVDCMNQLREEGIPKKEAIVKATVMRIRPVLMTAVTTILGLLPLALGMGMGAEIIQPVAVVCIGGLTYATLTTLLIIPILYDIMRREKKPAASEASSIPELEKAD